MTFGILLILIAFLIGVFLLVVNKLDHKCITSTEQIMIFCFAFFVIVYMFVLLF